ncbi:hypothetical protein CTRI78_v011523 [Colletotrichum trifolii]|uniref:Heterokaryon incompatibility domain-containing protein n=1 Tax=Colletotrichum trifolii TaxID=5466 RepID=A0A4R8Q980_COLTR|nr:hypothetical protein CTRI78_v011523 [Colletotrichum trifolii]
MHSIASVSLDEALGNPTAKEARGRSSDFFDTLGTVGCLLDCEAYAYRQKLAPEVIRTSRASHEEFAKRGKHRVVQGRAFTYGRLGESADNGCGACKAVKTMLDAVPAQHIGGFGPFATIRWVVRHSGTLEIAMPDGKAYYARIMNVAGSRNVFRRMQTTNGLAGDTSSPLSLQRVRNWLEDRLIDLDDITRGDDEGVRLVDTSGQTGTYMCLSHCWGKVKIHSMTKTASLQDRLDFIPWSLLPPSFQQAVEMTRQLGIRYLWIDSLCIIQDDGADWEREAAQMVNVYRNGYATIAVSWSHDSQGGCYTRTIPPIYFRTTTDTEAEFTTMMGIGGKRDDTSEYERVHEYYPFFSRAWCLQERLLSRRIIHCNYGELAFDCGKGYSCECGGKQHYNWHNVAGLSGTYTPLRSRSKYLSILNNRAAVSSSAIVTPSGKIDPYERWHRVVGEYTCLNLTKTSDMLPALSGLARETAELTGDAYLVGLWKGNLEQELLWRVVSVADWRHRRDAILKRDWTAPSWSWASTGSGCKVGFPAFYGAEVLECKIPGISPEMATITCPPSGTDPTGSVAFGKLEARAARLPVMIQKPCSKWDAKRRWTNRIYGRFLLFAKESEREWREDCRPRTGEPPLEFGPAKASLWVDPIVEKLTETGDGYVRNQAGHDGYDPLLCKHCVFLPAELLYVRGMKTDKGVLSSTRTRDIFLIVSKDPESLTDSRVRVGLLEVTCDDRTQRDEWFETVWKRNALPEMDITVF